MHVPDTIHRDPETYAAIGAAMEVHRQLGHGFLERVYQEALAMEFQHRGVPFAREVEFEIAYKGQQLNCPYRADFVCHAKIIVEVKALQRLTGVESSQVLNYLKATNLKRGLILNFGAPSLEYKRVVHLYQSE